MENAPRLGYGTRGPGLLRIWLLYKTPWRQPLQGQQRQMGGGRGVLETWSAPWPGLLVVGEQKRIPPQPVGLHSLFLLPGQKANISPSPSPISI